MDWEIPEYSKSKVDSAGNTLINEDSTTEQKVGAIKILDSWRAGHSYPMHIFQTRLYNRAKLLDKDSIVAQRLKRVPSILFKLMRKYNGREASMKLSQMQDIGGCRAILPTAELAKELCEKSFLKSNVKHKLINKKDYITYPKKDGYRSVHLIYAFKSDKKGKTVFNGLLTEIQIRSKLQHIWATAVETVDFFTRQSIKCSEGDKDWKEFFRLASSAFARLENCPTVSDTPEDEKELYLKIKEKERNLNIHNLLEGWTNAMTLLDQRTKEKAVSKDDFFLLELDIYSKKLILTSYSKENKERAIEDYSRAEKKYEGNKEYDVVLVSASTTNDLRKAYPNYFVDTREFLKYLTKITTKY